MIPYPMFVPKKYKNKIKNEKVMKKYVTEKREKKKVKIVFGF